MYKVLLSLFVFIQTISFAQLSGTYTIGGTSPDFVDINSAISALETQGISATVIFNIRSDVYNGQYRLNEINGASPTKRIIFQSELQDPSSVTLSYNATGLSDDYIFLLDSADYVNIAYLTFKPLNLDYVKCIELINEANGVIISNNILNAAGATSATNNALIESNQNALSVDPNTDSITIDGNIFIGGAYGIYWRAYTIGGRRSENVFIGNNEFLNQFSMGIYFSGFRYGNISKNVFTCTNSASAYAGLYLSTGNNDMKVMQNYFYINKPIGDAIGINCNNALSSTGSNNRIIANNMVSVSGTQRAYGIVAYNFGNEGITVANNSVAVYSSQVPVASFYLDGAKAYFENANFGVDSLRLFNNIFANLGPEGYAIHIKDNTGTTPWYANNIYYSASGDFGYYEPTVHTSLASWQGATGQDATSFFTNPDFVSMQDLHICHDTADGGASPVSGLNVDFDGQARNPTTPDIGADEFNIAAIITANAGIDVIIADEDSVQLNGTGNASIYLWSPSVGLSDTTILNPIANPDTTTTYYLTVSDACGNVAIDSIELGIGFSVTGTVFNGSMADTVKLGLVSRWKFKKSGQIVFDGIIPINPDGSYTGDLMLYNKDYLIRGVPNDSAYPSTMKTYYPDKVVRDSAQIIRLTSDTSGINITCLIPPPMVGTGKIWGQAIQGNIFGKVQGPGDPFNGIDISLIDKSTGGAVAQDVTKTDTAVGDSGVFAFESVEENTTFNLFVDVNGVPVDAGFDLTITSSVQEIYVIILVDSTNISMVDTVVVGVPILTTKSIVALYPNPVDDYLILDMNLRVEDDVRFYVQDLNGRQIHSYGLGKHKGIFNIRLPLDDLATGVYLGIIEIGKEKITRKIFVK